MIKSICVVRLSALGDVLMLVPMIRTLQLHFPEASITWVISPPAYFLVEGMKGVEFIVIKKPGNLKDFWRFKQSLKGRQFDVLLACQASFRANLLYPLISAQRKVGYDSVRAKDGHGLFVHERIKPGHEHTLEGFLKFAEHLGCASRVLKWDLSLNEGDYALALQHIEPDKRCLLINPAASKPERSWAVERYIHVIKYAQQVLGLQVILTGGPGTYDRSLTDEILKKVDCTDMVGKTTPKQLLALIDKADAVLCPDTGPSHMAAAMNTPVVALHAVTSSEVSGPYPFLHLAVDCYPEAVETVLKKEYGKQIWGTHAHGEKTMELVTVGAVIEKLNQVFQADTAE